MSEKTYTENGYAIEYTNFMLVFNEELKDGYDWYVSKDAAEKGHAIGLKRKDKKKSVSCVNSLNDVRRKFKLY